MSRRVHRTCEHCGGGFETTAYAISIGNGKYCSRTCFGARHSQHMRKHNRIVADHGDWLEIDVSTEKHPRAIMKVDKKDWPALSRGGRWSARASANSNVLYAHRRDGNSTVKAHRLILPDAEQVDHIDNGRPESGLDNRRRNLRACTAAQNSQHRGGVQRNNPSGIPGVYWDKHLNKWVARITCHGTRICLGVFNNKRDAARRRKEAEAECFGDFAPSHHNGALA